MTTSNFDHACLRFLMYLGKHCVSKGDKMSTCTSTLQSAGESARSRSKTFHAPVTCTKNDRNFSFARTTLRN